MKIKDVFLPTQEGCQHIHFDIETNGKTEKVFYHLSDFTGEITHQDATYFFIREQVVKNGYKTREEIKQLKPKR